jgi:AraC-like DNA-binding protein
MRLTLITNVPKTATPALPPTRHWHSSQRTLLETSPWPEALQAKALCIHLNFHGEAHFALKAAHSPTLVLPQRLIWTRSPHTALRTTTRDRHECLTLVFPDAWLQDNLADLLPQVPESSRLLVSKPFAPVIRLGRALTEQDRAWARSLMASHLCDAARLMLDKARLTDFLLRELFATDSNSTVQDGALISRAERAAHERVERVKAHLLKHLDENHELESLATAVGCSPHYLSRTFTQVTGTPLMLWIRRARIDCAATLIATGRCNVSEAALEVGYRSFSHFSRAFQQEKGVPPSKWITHLAQTRLTQKKPPNSKT